MEKSSQHGMFPQFFSNTANLANTKTEVLSRMPTELLFKIFDYLGRCPAACFGLTCARVYDIYKLHRKTNGIRMARLDMRGPEPEDKQLHAYLREWIGKKFIYGGLTFGFKYVTREAVARHFGTTHVREKTIRSIERKALKDERWHIVFYN